MKKFSRVFTAQPHLLRGEIISVEISISRGLHAFHIVGMAGKSVDEARSRVGAALHNCEYPSPKHINQKTVVALAPADLHKNGSRYDLAIAIGYLVADGTLRPESNILEKSLFLGELGLDGYLKPINGSLALVQRAKESGFTHVYVPQQNAREAACIEGITIYPCNHLVQVCKHLDPEHTCPADHDFGSLAAIEAYTIPPDEQMGDEASSNTNNLPCFSHVRGQAGAKRGLMIAAAGRHNVALYGPPGTGKSMLAQAFTGILPPLSQDEMLEVTRIHSIAGIFTGELSKTAPLRSPHHTASYVSIIGGGTYPQPGEITLAHHGVLFLDEFPEFENRVIESLRQPLEDKKIHISRASASAEFPADCIVVAALNPCPCGFYGTKVKPCSCSPYQLERYQKRLSGPIVDRIDMWLPVEHIDYEHFHIPLDSENTTDTSLDIQKKVTQARTHQYTRNGEGKSNSHLKANDLTHMELAEEVRDLLIKSARALDLSPRSYHRVIKLARTIADIEGEKEILGDHVLESLQYRPKISYGTH